MRKWDNGWADGWVVGSLATLVVCAVILITGCRRPKPPPAPPSRQATPELPAAVNTQGIRINWRAKQKDGKLWRVLDLKAANGKIDAQSQSGIMSNATGTLYRADRAKAEFEAPKVRAANDRKTVVATGGVKVRSLEPPGMLVTADQATWIIEKNVIIAKGHVYMEQRDPKTKRIRMWGRSDQLTVNTDIREFSIP